MYLSFFLYFFSSDIHLCLGWTCRYGDVAGSFVPTFIKLMLFGDLPTKDDIGNPHIKEQIDDQHVAPCPSIDLRGVIHEIQSSFVCIFHH